MLAWLLLFAPPAQNPRMSGVEDVRQLVRRNRVAAIVYSDEDVCAIATEDKRNGAIS